MDVGDIILTIVGIIVPPVIGWIYRKKIILWLKHIIWWFTNKCIPITVTQTVIFPVRKKEGFSREDARIIKEITGNKDIFDIDQNIQIYGDCIQLVIIPKKLAGFTIRINIIDETIMVEDILGEEFSDQEKIVVEFTTVGGMDFYYRQTDKLEAFYEFTDTVTNWLRFNKFNNKDPIKNYTIIKCNEIIKLKKGERKRLERGNIIFIQSEKGLRIECKEFSQLNIIKAVRKYFTLVVAS